MSPSLFYLLLLIFSSTQYAKCDNVPAQAPPRVDKFKKDWTFNGKDRVIYPQQWFHQHEFTFVVHNTTEDYCTVVHARTDNSSNQLRTYDNKFKKTDGEKVTIDRVSAGFGADGTGITIYWFTPTSKNHGYIRSSSVNMNDCWKGRYAPGKLESEPSGAPQNTSDSASEEKDFEYLEDIDDDLKGSNYLLVGGIEGPVKINSTEGIFFLGQKKESNTTVDAVFMEIQSKEIQVLGSIENFSLGKNVYRTSRHHNKFGECWMETTTKIKCSQQELLHGSPNMVLFTQTANLPGPIDWFVMANLKEKAILLITGKCSGKMCNSYSVRKIGEYESKVLVDIDDLQVECENPSSLTNNIVDYKENSVFCFHLVCNQEYGGDKSGIKVQYRRHCIQRDIVTSWG